MSEFKEIISGMTPTICLLPLFQTVDIYELRSILKSKIIPLKECDSFKAEYLSYCFYGRPAYRLKHNKPTCNYAKFPACFILKTVELPKPYKIFPFDTGAFNQITDLKERYFHENMEINDFLLGNDFDFARSLVEKFYSSNDNYFNATPSLDENEIPAINLEARAYFTMISEKAETDYDDRLSTIEIIFNEGLTISERNVETIILTKCFFDDSTISNIIKNEFKIESPITYETHRGNPKEYHAKIVSEAKQYLHQKSLI